MARIVTWLGWDQREQDAYDVAKKSILRYTPEALILPVQMDSLVKAGLYTRPTERRGSQLWDVISDAPMSTQHAIARFWVPFLCNYHGWVLSADCDILLRQDLEDVYAYADPRYALMVVQHDYQPKEAVKMDGQIQTAYARKNWSSVILWNCSHPAHRALTGLLNRVPGRDLHRFCWLRDDEIGALPLHWNYLVGVSPRIQNVALAHFTLGIPSMPGYQSCEFANEWRAYNDPVRSLVSA